MSIIPRRELPSCLGTFVIQNSGASGTNNDFQRASQSSISGLTRMINATDRNFRVTHYEFLYSSEGSFSIALRFRQSVSGSTSTIETFTITSTAQSIKLDSDGYVLKPGTSTGSDFLICDATVTGVANSELFLSIWGVFE